MGEPRLWFKTRGWPETIAQLEVMMEVTKTPCRIKLILTPISLITIANHNTTALDFKCRFLCKVNFIDLDNISAQNTGYFRRMKRQTHYGFSYAICTWCRRARGWHGKISRKKSLALWWTTRHLARSGCFYPLCRSHFLHDLPPRV